MQNYWSHFQFGACVYINVHISLPEPLGDFSPWVDNEKYQNIHTVKSLI